MGRLAVGVLVARETVGHIFDTDDVAVPAVAALFLELAGSGADGHGLGGVAAAVDVGVGAAVVGQHLGVAAGIVVGLDRFALETGADSIHSVPLAGRMRGALRRFGECGRAVRGFHAADTFGAAEAVTAMSGLAVGVLIACVAVGEIGRAHPVAVGVCITILVHLAQCGADRWRLLHTACAGDAQVGTAVVHQDVLGAGRVVGDIFGSADKQIAGRLHPESLACDLVFADRRGGVFRWAVAGCDAAIAGRAAKAVGAVPGGAVAVFIALCSRPQVLQACAVAMVTGQALAVLGAA